MTSSPPALALPGQDQQARRQLRQRAFVNSFIYFSTIPVVLSALLAGWVRHAREFPRPAVDTPSPGSAAQFIPPQVHRQPPGTYTFRQHLARVLPVVVVPALLYAVYALVMRALRWADSRDAARVKKLLENQRKMVKELKVRRCCGKSTRSSCETDGATSV